MAGMPGRRITWIVGVALMGSGCGDGNPSASAGGSERWGLSDEPTLEIGVVEGDERYQFHEVKDVARLGDGRIAVAHQGTAEIRVFDAEGRFMLAGGGPGDGPGEWRQVAAVHALPGDTLVVVDPLLDRVGLVDAATGAYLGELGEVRASEILPRRRHHTGLILEAPAGFEAWGALEMAARGADVRSARAPAEIRLDDEGRLWVFPAPSAAESSLRVLDLEGAERAVLPLPDRFEPLAVDEHEVIGVWRDSLDVEHLRAYAIEGADGWTGSGAAGSVVADSDDSDAGAAPAEAPEIVAHFRNIAIAQEMQYPGTGSYTTDLAALAEAWDFDLPSGLRVDFLAAGPTGWWGRLIDMETGAGCTLVYGAFLPVEGLATGTPACWDGPGDGGAGTDP